jgi:uncharacterized membrane protein
VEALSGKVDPISSRKERAVADLIVIGYEDEETAHRAAEEVERLADELLIEPEAVAVITRDRKGRFRVTTNHHPVAEGATWGMLWGALFGLLFFIPIFGLAVGSAFGALFGVLRKTTIDEEFERQVRELMKPGTSALFMIVDKVTPDKAVEALSAYGGTVLKTSFSKEAEAQLQAALHGEAGATSPPAA